MTQCFKIIIFNKYPYIQDSYAHTKHCTAGAVPHTVAIWAATQGGICGGAA